MAVQHYFEILGKKTWYVFFLSIFEPLNEDVIDKFIDVILFFFFFFFFWFSFVFYVCFFLCVCVCLFFL